MKCYTFILLLIGVINIGFSQNDKRLEGIEDDFEKILKASKAPGFAVAVVDRDKVIYAEGFGYSDYENKVPMDANTLLAIGSSTKAFTCAVLGQLKDEGNLSFDDSPIQYIPDLRFYNMELNDGINIRDLMCHQTGIPRHDGSWYLFPTYDKDSLIQRIQYHEPFTGLRQKWYYNNFMYLTQGVIAERITGKSWEQNIRDRFFKVLEMERSNLSIAELEKSTNAAKGYELYKDSVIRKMDYYRIAGMAPAGSINSSVKEMANWLKVWINNGKFNDVQVLSEAYRQEAMSSHSIITNALPGKEHPDIFMANYGYGWMISSYRGHYRVEHGGNIDGFSASVAFFPSDSIGIVVLANQNGSSVPSLVRNTVSDRMLEVEKTDWAKDFMDKKVTNQQQQDEAKKADKSKKEKTAKPTHELEAYEGQYFHPGYGRFSISSNSGALYAHFKRAKFYLKHVHYDVFEPFEVSSNGIDSTVSGLFRFNFTTNNAGEIASAKLKLEPALEAPIEFKHVPNILEVEVSALQKYIGEYEIANVTIKIYTKDDGELYMFVPGQPEYHLLASDKNLFIVKGLEGYKVKFTETNKAVSELTLLQPNGNFKAKKK